MLEAYGSLVGEVGNVSGLWLENKPDLVQGWINTFKRSSNPALELRGARDVREARERIEEECQSVYVVDIKLDREVDGITFARRVRRLDSLVPLYFVSSYLSEYESRLAGVPNVFGVHDRIDLRDECFQEFRADVIESGFAYAILKEYEVLLRDWESFVADDHRKAFATAHSMIFGRKVRRTLLRRGWVWGAVCGRRVVTGSKNLSTFPGLEEKRAIARRYGKVPFIYTRPVVSEEGSLNVYLDHYPRLMLDVAGSEALADLDTGTNQTLVSDEVTEPDVVSVPERGRHLGKPYSYSVNRRMVKVRSSKVGGGSIGPLAMPVAIVADWRRSPWIILNPTRQALVGRDLFATARVDLRILSQGQRGRVETVIAKLGEEDD